MFPPVLTGQRPANAQLVKHVMFDTQVGASAVVAALDLLYGEHLLRSGAQTGGTGDGDSWRRRRAIWATRSFDLVGPGEIEQLPQRVPMLSSVFGCPLRYEVLSTGGVSTDLTRSGHQLTRAFDRYRGMAALAALRCFRGGRSWARAGLRL